VSEDRNSDEAVAKLLSEVRTIAVVGASDKPSRPSYGVMAFLIERGYVVHPINPRLAGREIMGRMTYADLADVPGPVDMVEVFRRSEDAGAAVHQAIALKDELSIRAVWLQLGVIDGDAMDAAEAAGLVAVMDRCPAIELSHA
jgi:predicted CoA-binding protein